MKEKTDGPDNKIIKLVKFYIAKDTTKLTN